MKTIWVTKCHRCNADNKVVTGRSAGGVLLTNCSACGYEWPDYYQYLDEYKDAFNGVGPFPLELSLSEEALAIQSGEELAKDISDELTELMRLVEKNFLIKMMQDLNKLGYGRPPEDAHAMVWIHLNALKDEYDAYY